MSSDFVLAGWLLIGLYMIMVILLVVRAARKTESISDYALGNIAFSPYAVALSLAASMTSAATFIINPGFVALYGLSAVLSFAIVMPAAALISLVLLTKGFRKYGHAINALTMAQWIGKRYKSNSFAILFAILSLLLITFIVLICVGITKVLSATLEVDQVYTLVGVIIFIFGYMMFGGANSMVYTNMAQALLMMVVAVILLTSGFEYFQGGIDAFLGKLETIDSQLTKSTYPGSPLFRDYFEIIFCQIVIGIAIVCQPHIITKSLLLKSDRTINQFLIVAVIVEILFFFVVFTGLYARLSFPDLMLNGVKIPMDNIISSYVVNKFSVSIGLVVVMGLISAGISTLEGLIQSLSTSITSDLIDQIWGEKLFRGVNAEKTKIWVNRLVILGLAIIAFAFSYDQMIRPNLSVAIFAQNGVYAYFSAAFIPVLFGTFFKNVPLIAPVSASITAVIVHFSVYYLGITSYMEGAVRNPAIASTFAILAASVVGITFMLTRRRSV